MINETAEKSSIIQLEAKKYIEKVFIKRDALRILGAGADESIISFDDYADKIHDDGRDYGTFRSYTAYFGCERLYAENFTIENTAGDGSKVGQAVAAYIDCRYAYFKNVHFKAFQDTIFMTPLPEKPIIAGSFKGPNENKERLLSTVYFDNCYIEGTIDFIFGGATAVFDNCHIHSLKTQNNVCGYIAAPSTDPGVKTGFIFNNCKLTGENGAEAYLARPWRSYGKTVFLDCEIGSHINPAGWDPWGKEENKKTTYFAETTPLFNADKRAEWAHILTEEEKKSLKSEMEIIKKKCTFDM